MLLALFQLAEPSVFTLQKLDELPLLGERSHHQFALLTGRNRLSIIPLAIGFEDTF